MTITVQGDAANLNVLTNQIRAEFGEQVVVTVAELPLAPDELRHGILAEVTISVVAGLGANALYDGIRVLISRAEARGSVEVAEESTIDDEPPAEAG